MYKGIILSMISIRCTFRVTSDVHHVRCSCHHDMVGFLERPRAFQTYGLCAGDRVSRGDGRGDRCEVRNAYLAVLAYAALQRHNTEVAGLLTQPCHGRTVKLILLWFTSCLAGNPSGHNGPRFPCKRHHPTTAFARMALSRYNSRLNAQYPSMFIYLIIMHTFRASRGVFSCSNPHTTAVLVAMETTSSFIPCFLAVKVRYCNTKKKCITGQEVWSFHPPQNKLYFVYVYIYLYIYIHSFQFCAAPSTAVGRAAHAKEIHSGHRRRRLHRQLGRRRFACPWR